MASFFVWPAKSAKEVLPAIQWHVLQVWFELCLPQKKRIQIL